MERTEAQKERKSATMKIYHAKVRDKRLAYMRSYYAANRDKKRVLNGIATAIANNYTPPLPPTRPNPGYCECCGRKQTPEGQYLALDHCHKTGRFRGWLCMFCNTAIGKLGDTVEGVKNALLYLERT